MKITIAAIGRASRGPERDLYDHYAGRIRWPLVLRELEEKRKLPAPQLMQREGELLLEAAPAGATLVMLDRRGKVLDSIELVGAAQIARIGVGILVRHLDGAEHELAARLAVDADVVGVGSGRIARNDAPRALQHAVLHGLEHARRGLGLVGADFGLGAGDHLLGRL